MTKQQYIDAIHKHLGTTFYCVFWSDYTPSPGYCGEYETKKEAIKAGIDNPHCLIEFYEKQDSNVRRDYMHGDNEIDCLRKLYKVLLE